MSLCLFIGDKYVSVLYWKGSNYLEPTTELCGPPSLILSFNKPKKSIWPQIGAGPEEKPSCDSEA